MKNLIFSLAMCLFATPGFAHEGHDKTPGAISAPHGGQLKGTSQHYIEVLPESSNIKMYLFTHDLKSVPMENLKIEAYTQLPKQKNKDKLNLKITDNAAEAVVDAKGSHRYTLEVKLTEKNKSELVKFNIEP